MKTPIEDLISRLEELKDRGIDLTMRGMILMLQNTLEQEKIALLDSYIQGQSDFFDKYSYKEKKINKKSLVEDIYKNLEKNKGIIKILDRKDEFLLMERNRRMFDLQTENLLEEAEKYFTNKYKKIRKNG